MNKDFNALHQKIYTGDSVIERGYKIYDEWIKYGFSSRKIARIAKRVAASVQAKRTGRACVEALSCLFALDTRIKEKYGSLLRCLFLYFSWRRETRALSLLRSVLKFSNGEKDIRTAIEIELQKLREKLIAEGSDDGDDETHGGRRNGKAEEEKAVSPEEKASEQAQEEKAEEITDAEETKEASEEKSEDISKQTPSDEPIKENGEKQQIAETAQEKSDITVQEEKEQLSKDERNESKEEKIVSDEKTESGKNNQKETSAYNDAVDSPPIYESSQDEKSTETKTSFIDEMVIDNMVKGDKSIIGYQRIDEAERNKAADIPKDTVSGQEETNKSTERDAYLYDKMIAADKGEAQQTLNVESAKQAEKVSETKTEAKNETTQSNEKNANVGQKNDDLRVPLQVDINVSHENKVANELNDTMSLESKLAYIQMQADIFREQLIISNKELGIDDNVEVVKIPEPDAVSPPSAVQNRK